MFFSPLVQQQYHAKYGAEEVRGSVVSWGSPEAPSSHSTHKHPYRSLFSALVQRQSHAKYGAEERSLFSALVQQQYHAKYGAEEWLAWQLTQCPSASPHSSQPSMNSTIISSPPSHIYLLCLCWQLIPVSASDVAFSLIPVSVSDLIPVSASDVAFSVHAVALTAFTVWQCMVYDRGGQRVSWTCKAISLGVWLFALLSSLLSSFHHDWLGLVTTFNYIQVVMTTIKYIPQAWFNWQRRSTVGWSISNVLMDLTGGTASLLMMFVQSIDQNSFVNFTGNVGKLALSGETIAFDILFAVQHYVLFPHAPALPLSTTSAFSAHPPTLVSTPLHGEGEKEGKGKGEAEEEQLLADEFTRLLPSRRSGGLF
ncbi:unnamed protein product [Closterium sp. NIES-64]|nr:unnamed protein product [Closterium sp. NIES-64]